jgi:chromosome segregation ATPase
VERDQLAAANAELTRGLSEKEGVQTAAETAAAKLTEFQDQIKTLQEAVLAKTQEIARVNEAATLTAVSLEKETEECGRLRHVIETSHASVSAETAPRCLGDQARRA